MDEASGRGCVSCGGGKFLRLPYYYLFRGRRIHGVRCIDCGLVTVSPMLSRQELASLYDAEYFRADYHCGHREASYEDESFTAEHERVLRKFKAMKPSGMMLEVGAAGGKFLMAAKARGYEVMGVELSDDACRIAEGLGVPQFCGELTDAGFEGGSFNLAYMGDVLEHMPEPLINLRELYRVLAPGGVAGITCPTNIGLLSTRAGLWVYRMLGRERLAPIPPYHLYEFRPVDITRLIEKAGFTVIEVETDIIPPWRINLRGSFVEKAAKAALHWPNYVITLLTGKLGDRVTVFAKKPEAG